MSDGETLLRLGTTAYEAWIVGERAVFDSLDLDAVEVTSWVRRAITEHIAAGDTPLGAGESLGLRCLAVGALLERKRRADAGA